MSFSPSNMPKKVTLRDLAKVAGVSLATASRVASGTGRVTAETAARVRAAAQSLGLDLAERNKTKLVGFLLGNRPFLHPFHSRVLVGAEAYCAAREYNVMFFSLRYEPSIPWKDLHVPAILDRRDLVCGYILAGKNYPNLMELLHHRGIPFAVVGNNVMGDWRSQDYDVVWIDDIPTAYEATKFLRTLGHRAIWYVGNCQLPWFARRCEGYRRAMVESGATPRVSEIESEDYAEIGYLATRSILHRGEPMTAIVTGSDNVVRGIYKALADCGRRIPEDVSVIGFNDLEAAIVHPPLTTVRTFPDQVGRQLAQMLLNRVAHPDLPPQTYTLPTELIKRESHQPPSVVAERGSEPQGASAQQDSEVRTP